MIRRGRELFADMPPDVEVEIRNQGARAPLGSRRSTGSPARRTGASRAGIDSWASTSAMLGVRLEEDGALERIRGSGLVYVLQHGREAGYGAGGRGRCTTRRWRGGRRSGRDLLSSRGRESGQRRPTINTHFLIVVS